MNKILRFDGSLKHDPAIDAWFDMQSGEFTDLAREWFNAMRNCGSDVRELMHDGFPVACVEDLPFGYVNVFKDHINVGFFHGAELDDPDGILEGTGKQMRHVKLKPDDTAGSSYLGVLVKAAYSHIKTLRG